MSKEFDDLKKATIERQKKMKTRQTELYQYARSLGFPSAMAQQLRCTSKDKILRLSKELSK